MHPLLSLHPHNVHVGCAKPNDVHQWVVNSRKCIVEVVLVVVAEIAASPAVGAASSMVAIVVVADEEENAVAPAHNHPPDQVVTVSDIAADHSAW